MKKAFLYIILTFFLAASCTQKEPYARMKNCLFSFKTALFVLWVGKT